MSAIGSMDNLQVIPVRSSLLSAAAYDPDTCELHITFSSNGARWIYSGVDEAVADQLASVESQGRFFLTEVKGMYPERRA